MATIIAAESDIEYARDMEECLQTLARDGLFHVRMNITNNMTRREWENLEKEIKDGTLIFPLFTRNLVKDKKFILNLLFLVRRCMHHSNAFGNFFYPVYFDGQRERQFLPLFFQGWRGVSWFSRKKQLTSIVLQKKYK